MNNNRKIHNHHLSSLVDTVHCTWKSIHWKKRRNDYQSNNIDNDDDDEEENHFFSASKLMKIPTEYMDGMCNDDDDEDIHQHRTPRWDTQWMSMNGMIINIRLPVN